MSSEPASTPKYEIIIEDLMNKIKQNEFTYDAPFCTEKQLSETYGVSRITAKRAITDMEHLGILYRKRGVGSFVSRDANLKSETQAAPDTDTKTFSFLLPFDSTKGGLWETVQVVNESLSGLGYFMGMYISDISAAKEKANLKLLLSQNTSGLIYYPNRDKIYLDLLNEFVMRGKPVIIIDKNTDCPYLHNIVSDNMEGGRLLTEHLITLGHKNIAFLTTAAIEDTSSIRNRFAGFLAALRTAGIAPNAANVIYLPCSLSEAARTAEHGIPQLNAAVKKLHSQGATAIVAENDQVAYYIWQSCRNIGLKVPEDLSICGFDNTNFSQMELGFTTVSQDFHQFGLEISSILTESMSSPNAPVRHVVVPVQLIVRDSTAVPAASRH